MIGRDEEEVGPIGRPTGAARATSPLTNFTDLCHVRRL